MELYDEKIEEKKSKVPMIIGSCTVALILIMILIVIGIVYLKGSATIIKIDGAKNNQIEKMLYIESTEEGLQIYVPILKIAPILGYQGFNGDYLNKSEDKTKCHVVSENETAMFTKDSDTLIKIAEGSEIEYMTLDKAVFEKDGELYTTIDGIQKAFNIMIAHDEKFKNIDMFSMDYLVQYYATKLGLEGETESQKKYSTEFTDKKAIFEDMIIIEENNNYGVINVTTGDNVLEVKYEEIEYLPATTDFIVKSNGKYGIVKKDATVKVRTIYDDIQTMDNKNGLYLVKQNNSYGVININGDVVIAPEYKQIGLNIGSYAQNGVDNSFVLLNKIIPIQNHENLWGFFDVNGTQINEFKYTGVGCNTSFASNSYPALIIPSYEMIVVQQNKFYNIVTSAGEQLVPDNTLNAVYLKTNAETGENQYFMTYNENQKVINVEEYLKSTGR